MSASLILPILLAAAPLVPGVRYDDRIPKFEAVVGHQLGERLTGPEAITSYLEALASAAPDRARVVEYARSEEGRPLRAIVIGARERVTQLDRIKADVRSLADPRTLSSAQADRLLAEAPAVVWLMGGVHGDEISSPEAALALAHHLLAALDDPVADLVRQETLVIIDPLANPDGRARFLSANRLAQGPEPDPEPRAAEHDAPWPGGRGNHYLFDMNRDWFAATQPETRGRQRLFLEWYPQVAVDLHEMKGDSTYFFAPPARPINPHFSPAQQHWLDVFGRAIAARFDAAGQPYFVREVFDSFYPGYGESWPMTHGAVGMTFEQASARGLAWRREDGTVLTYLDGIRNHFRAGLATVEAAARGRTGLVRDFLEFRRAAIREGETGPLSAFVLGAGDDPERTARFADLLARQGVELRVAAAELRDGQRRFPAGSVVVPLAQPAGRLVRNLLERRVPMDDAFIQEQERRRKKRLPDQIYDVTGWSLPALFGLDCAGASRALVGETRSYAAPATDTAAPLPAARVAWLMPWGAGTAGAVVEALRAGLKVRVAEAGFRLGDRSWPAGSAIVRVGENRENAREVLEGILRRHAVHAVGVDSAFVEEGVSLGSERVHLLSAPRVLLVWDSPASSTSAGWARWVLEKRYAQPVSAVRVGRLGDVDLRRYDVVVLPAGDYGDAIGRGNVRRLRAWIEAGGTLVALGEASRWLTRERAGLLATKTELRDGRPEAEPKPEEAEARPAGAKEESAKEKDRTEPFDLAKAIEPEKERPDAIPGALLRVLLDQEHWLSAGLGGAVDVVADSRRVFTPLKLDRGTNVGLYATKADLVVAGYAWPDVRDLLAQKAFLMHQPIGEGHVVAFAEDPNYRGYAETTELLFMNAVLLGPAY